MFQYLYIDVVDDVLVFTYWCGRRRFSIHILIWQKMIQYPHTDVVEDDPVHIEDDSVSTYRCCRRWSSTLMLRSMMKMYDGVPKLPMAYRDSPVRCTFVVVVSTLVEYLPSWEGVLKYSNFRIYSKCIDCIPPSGDEFGHVRVIERINVNLWM